jgi:hypothetical protein
MDPDDMTLNKVIGLGLEQYFSSDYAIEPNEFGHDQETCNVVDGLYAISEAIRELTEVLRKG